MFRDIFCFFSYFSFWKCKNEAVILKLLTVVYLVFTEFPNLQLFNFDTLWKMENNYFNNKLSFSIKIGLGFGGWFLDTVLTCVEKQGGF